jgi:AraC-like DNA-binding protein
MSAAGSGAPSHYYVTSPLLWPMVLGLKALGLDTDALLATTGVSQDLLKNPDSRFPAETGLRLLQAALDASGDENLGLRLSELYAPGVFTVLDYLAHSSDTLREAIERTCSYERIHQNGVRTTLEVEGARAMLKQQTLVPWPLPRQVSENSLANMLVIGRHLTGKALIPQAVWFTHPEPRDTREHKRLFGCPLRFNAEYDALVFDAAWLDLPLQNANRQLAETLERHARELLGKLSRGHQLSDRVRETVAARLPNGVISLDRIARALDIKPRTLQRRLREEGTSHEQLLEELRIELALRYLAEADLGIEDVALMLGFSDSRAFRRAFKRWRGVSPSEHRAAKSA